MLELPRPHKADFFQVESYKGDTGSPLSRSGGSLSTGMQSTYDSQIHCASFRDYFYTIFQFCKVSLLYLVYQDITINLIGAILLLFLF